MKNASPNKRSAAGRQSKLRPGVNATTKSEKQRAEQITIPTQTLRDSEVRYRRLFEAAQDGILILDAQTGAIEDVNPYLIDMLGYSRAEFLKKKLWEVGAFKDVESSKIEFNILQENGYVRYENLPLRAKGGQLIQVEFVSNVYLAGGKIVIQCNIRNITDRIQAEEIRSDLAAIVESSDDAIIGKTLDGIITSWNSGAQRLYGYSAEELIGQSISVLIPSDRPDELLEILSRLNHGERVEHYETIRVGKDGMRLDVSVTISPIKDVSGRVVGVSTIARNITERKHAEEEIQKLAKFPGENPFPVLRMNEKGVILYANTASRTLLEEWKTDIGREAPSFLWMKATEALANRCKQVFEISLGARIISFTAIPIIEENYVNLYGEDITERKRAEEALLDSEDKFRSFFDHSVVGHSITLTSGEIQVNKSFCEMLGYSPEELQNNTWQDITHPDDIELTQRKLDTLLSGEKEAVRFTKRYLHKNGSVVWTDLSTSLRRDKHGKPLYFMTTAVDITERIHAEDALRKALEELEMQVQQRTADLSQSNMLLRTLLDNIPDQIYFKDLESRFIKNSKAQATALGLSDPSEVVGKTDFDYFPHAQRSYDEEQEIIRSGKPLVDYEEDVVWPDGHETWVSTTKVPLRDREDKIIGTFGISRDITGRKRNEEALRKASDELEAFSYSVSHDLRAPLRGIDGWSLALLEDYSSQLDEQGQEYIMRVRSEAQHMDQLIDDLLKLSRITRAEMHSDRVDLSASARSIARRLQEDEPQRHVEFIIQNGLSAIGDAHLLEVMLTNLLSNAFKFTGKVAEARIEFGQMDMDGQRVFFVRDNGAGFDMAYAKKLFGAFQRMHKDSEFPGTGIGLATVQRIINRHGGRVWAESAVNQGATFFFTL